MFNLNVKKPDNELEKQILIDSIKNKVQINENTTEKMIKFYSVGNGTNTYIFMPFYPFTVDIFINFIKQLDLANNKYIFCELNKNIIGLSSTFTYDYLRSVFINVLRSFKETKINIVGFGVFANLSADLAINIGENLGKLIMFEPDFNCVALDEVFFEKKRKMFYKKDSFINYYINPSDLEIMKRNLSKFRLKYLFSYYSTQLEAGIKEKYLKGLIALRDSFYIVWSSMSSESWPLAQVFEENGINLINPGASIVSMINNNDSSLKRLFYRLFS